MTTGCEKCLCDRVRGSRRCTIVCARYVDPVGLLRAQLVSAKWLIVRLHPTKQKHQELRTHKQLTLAPPIVVLRSATRQLLPAWLRRAMSLWVEPQVTCPACECVVLCMAAGEWEGVGTPPRASWRLGHCGHFRAIPPVALPSAMPTPTTKLRSVCRHERRTISVARIAPVGAIFV